MAGRKRNSAEDIVRKLRRADELTAAGKTEDAIAAELCVQIPIVSQSIVAVEFGFSLLLQVSEGYEIRVESAFQLNDPQRGRFDGIPDERLAADRVFETLVGRSIEEAQASEGGTLRLLLSGGATLTVPADSDFEAWTVAGPGGLKIVSEAGGGLAVWNLDTP
jgi:hypothetical protein